MGKLNKEERLLAIEPDFQITGNDCAGYDQDNDEDSKFHTAPLRQKPLARKRREGYGVWHLNRVRLLAVKARSLTCHPRKSPTQGEICSK